MLLCRSLFPVVRRNHFHNSPISSVDEGAVKQTPVLLSTFWSYTILPPPNNPESKTVERNGNSFCHSSPQTNLTKTYLEKMDYTAPTLLGYIPETARLYVVSRSGNSSMKTFKRIDIPFSVLDFHK